MTTTELDLRDDVIDVRDLIARVEELEEARDALREEFDAMPENAGIDFDRWVCDMTGGAWSREDQTELDTLTAILDNLKGYGGDEQWRGDWYPVTLIAESYFTDYAQELVLDCYDLKGLPTFVHIDWELTAREVKVDYSEIEIDGATYLYR